MLDKLTKRYATVKEAAKELGVTPTRVRKLISDGILKAETGWEVTLVSRESLAKWLKKPKQPGGRPRKSLSA